MSPAVFSLALLGLLVGCRAGPVRPGADAGGVAPSPSPAPSPPVVDMDPARTPSPPPRPPSGPPDASEVLEIRRIGQWTTSGITEPRRQVIRDPDAWSRFWAELGIGDRTEVDFGRELVIAMAAGQHPSGGHEIAVQRVSLEDGHLRIEVLETSPGEGCMTTAALTQPVDVVAAPSAGVEGWSFVERRASPPC